MAETGDISGGIDLYYAHECYIMAASNNSAKAYFKLSYLYF